MVKDVPLTPAPLKDSELLRLQLQRVQDELQHYYFLYSEAALRNQSDSREWELDSARRKRAERARYRDAIRASTSWRVAAPIRWLRHVVLREPKVPTDQPLVPCDTLAEERAEIRKIDDEIRALLASTSWKVSAPLRWRPWRRYNRDLPLERLRPRPPSSGPELEAADAALRESDVGGDAPASVFSLPSIAQFDTARPTAQGKSAKGAGLPPTLPRRSQILRSPLGALQNRHLGQRCVLVANGPSLNQMDLSFAKQEICIGMNKIFLGFDRFGFYPHYYVAINDKVIKQAVVEIQALSCVKFVKRTAATGLLSQDALTHLVDTYAYRLDEQGLQRPGFSADIAQAGIYEGWTVTHAALQIAFFLGFTQVVIIGMDHRYQFEGNPNEARVLNGDDPNHFCSTYFGGGQTWDNPDLAHSEESYRLARREYEKVGREILDATVDGACDVFKKVDYRDIFDIEA